MIPYFLKKILAGDINSPNLLVFFEFAQKLQFFIHIHPDPPPPQTDPPPPLKFFFCEFSQKLFNSSITSTLTPKTRPLPLPPPPQIFFFEFSQKLQFFVHIHSDPPPPPTLPSQIFFFLIFTKTSILCSHPPCDPPPPPSPPPKKKKKKKSFHKNFTSLFTSTLIF